MLIGGGAHELMRRLLERIESERPAGRGAAAAGRRAGAAGRPLRTVRRHHRPAVRRLCRHTAAPSGGRRAARVPDQQGRTLRAPRAAADPARSIFRAADRRRHACAEETARERHPPRAGHARRAGRPLRPHRRFAHRCGNRAQRCGGGLGRALWLQRRRADRLGAARPAVREPGRHPRATSSPRTPPRPEGLRAPAHRIHHSRSFRWLSFPCANCSTTPPSMATACRPSTSTTWSRSRPSWKRPKRPAAR